MRWLTVIFILVLIGVVAAIKYLPWWALIILFVVPLLTWKYIAAGILALYMRKVAGELGKALAGAEVEVHSLEAVAAPTADDLKAMLQDEDEGDGDEYEDDAPEPDAAPDEDPSAWRWYELDVSITPRPPASEDENSGWSVGGLMLAVPDTKWGEFDGQCLVAQVERMEDGRFTPAMNWQAYGPERVRLLVGVRPGTSQVALQYMTEQLGDVLELPALPGKN